VSKGIRRELIGIAALVGGLFLGLTLLPWDLTGGLGSGLGRLLVRAFGAGAILIPIMGVGWALAAFGRLGTLSTLRTAALFAGLIILIPYSVGITVGGSGRVPLPAEYAQWTFSQKVVGLVPGFLAGGMRQVIGTAGGVLFGLFALSALGLVTVGWHPLAALRAREPGAVSREPAIKKRPGTPFEEDADLGPVEVTAKEGNGKRAKEKKPRESARVASRLPTPGSRLPPGSLIPPIELLTEPPPALGDADAAQIDEMGRRLLATLETFRVGGQIADKTVGPVVTRFELAPGPGVKVGRIAALADDLALAMKAQSLRIVAPIPGKAAVGIEVPNPTPRIVHLRELIDCDEFRRAGRTLPVVLGRNLEGEEVIDDLAKMPHLLIAGATGSGKSVCINTIITSLIYSHPPEKLKLLMIDPKMVELSMYAALPHLGLPVVTSHSKAAKVLKWGVMEMERRYRLLHANHARNIGDFNRKVEERKPLKGPRETLATQAGVQRELPFDAEYTDGILPYIVLIVDELADLMLTVQGEIETPLAVLAQKARAIGIHLLLATQRPSVNVITGLIKANFPCRIGFRVSAKVDSRTILDQNGAETLLGNGDMLFLPPGKSEPVRVQGAFIATEETERLMEWYQAHAPAAVVATDKPSIDAQVEAITDEGEPGAGSREPGEGERDTLFRQAAEVCIQNQLGSTSLLQRRMSIGYGRAARIIDQLEQAGILGPANGSKPRDVLVGIEELDEICGREP
jgi:DNA segregation ATPase FtsK/SpoIIIE, S-DNA-T family